MQLSAYLFMYGKCEEAMKFYQSALGGELELNHFEGSEHMPVPPEWEGKVMHATLHGDGFDLMGSDGRPGTAPVAESNISITLSMKDEAKARDAFAKLSAGGKIETPMEKMFWGAIFGQLTDK